MNLFCNSTFQACYLSAVGDGGWVVIEYLAWWWKSSYVPCSSQSSLKSSSEGEKEFEDRSFHGGEDIDDPIEWVMGVSVANDCVWAVKMVIEKQAGIVCCMTYFYFVKSKFWWQEHNLPHCHPWEHWVNECLYCPAIWVQEILPEHDHFHFSFSTSQR